MATGDRGIQRRMGSLAWDTHDNAIGMWQGYKIFQDWLGLDTEKLSIEEYVYWGGVLQGEGLSEYIRNFHRHMFDSSSAVFWALNDCWPMVRGWAIVDGDLRRTPPFHPVRRAFAPVNVAAVAEDDARDVVVYGINETREAVSATLRFGVFTLAGQYPVDRRQEVVLPPNASVPIATFTSKTFAWRVCLDLDGDRKLPDNFFDVYPGQPHTIPWPARTPPRILFGGNPAGRAGS